LAAPVAGRSQEPPGAIRVHAGARWARAHLFRRETLASRARIPGPAVITELSATTYVPTGWRATVDRLGNLHLGHAR
jgi:N-methylhydantoinase A